MPGICRVEYDPGPQVNQVIGINAGATRLFAFWDTWSYTYDYEWDICRETFVRANAISNVAVRPGISGQTTLWWFFNENPPNYATSVTLTATPAGAVSYSWQVVNGTAQVQFFDGSTSIVTTTNQVVVKSINSSGNPNDIGIKVTVRGSTSNEFRMTSLTPWEFALNSATHVPHATRGYVSTYTYTVRDQFQNILPSDVPYNEKFTSGVRIDYPGTNWGFPAGFGAVQPPNNMFDTMAPPEYSPFVTPAAVHPGAPDAFVQVANRDQEWYVGSTVSGSGRRVQTNLQRYYLGFAEHQMVVSPNP